jgi:hypothetical protein
VVVIEPREVKGQTSAVRRWNPRRVPADAVFIGDQACGECHKKHFASYSRSGMAEAMEPVATSKVLGANPQLRMRVGPYTYEIKRTGMDSSTRV